VNCFETGTVPDIMEIIDHSYLQLIGVVPYSKQLAEAQYKCSGQLANTLNKTDLNTYKAFENITIRIRGGNLPLMSGFRNYKKQKKGLILTNGHSDHS